MERSAYTLGWKVVRRPGGASGLGQSGHEPVQARGHAGQARGIPSKDPAADENGGLAPKAPATKANRTGESDFRESKTSFMHQKTAERVKCNAHEERKYLQSSI